jgi:hypothetical protein
VAPVAAQGPVSVQTPIAFPGNTGEAIPVGPFLFSPTLQLTWEDRDNIFLRPDGQKVPDNIYLARARLMFEVPVYESYFRFTYTPQYREFKTYDLKEKWSHFVDAGADLAFASGVELNLNYRFVNANLETSEVDPGGELFFADRMFTKHFGSVRFDYWATNRDGFTVDVDYTDLSYDDPTDLFYDYQRTSAGIGWLHQLTPILVMDAKYRYIKFEPVDTLRYRNSESDEITVGFEGQISPVVASQIRLGWRETTYDLQPGDDVQFENFSGPVIRGFLNWELAHGSSVRLDLLREDFPSNYDANAYYTATGGTLGYYLNRGRFFGDIFGRYQINDYEVPDRDSGLLRKDDIATFRLGLGYRFTEFFSLNGAYLYEERDSLPEYTYDVNIFTVSLVLGY